MFSSVTLLILEQFFPFPLLSAKEFNTHILIPKILDTGLVQRQVKYLYNLKPKSVHILLLYWNREMFEITGPLDGPEVRDICCRSVCYSRTDNALPHPSFKIKPRVSEES